jgi:hypothetical protein
VPFYINPILKVPLKYEEGITAIKAVFSSAE